MSIREKKQPPSEFKKNMHLDLFGQFITNDASEVSNAIEIWESIPKYFFTPRQVVKLRNKTGHADPFKWEFTRGGSNYVVKIQPAMIEQKDGSYKAFFPGVTEELVEEALKKILTDQRYGSHNSKQLETWVKFTLRMIYKELKDRGRSRNITEIKHAIEVMSSCIITVLDGKKEIWRGAILQDLVTIGRDEYIEDSDAHHVTRLPLFVSQSLNELQYRQINYNRLMSCNEQLTRHIYRRLVIKFRHANHMNNYHFMYSDLKHSGLLQSAEERDNRKKVKSALNELENRGVIVRFEVDERLEGRKVVDVKFTVYPSTEFIKDQKAANKREKDARELLEYES
jgi:hypothetical protein